MSKNINDFKQYVFYIQNLFIIRSTSRIEIKNGMRVFLPHFGLSVVVYEYRNANNQMSESGVNGYVAEFNFFYEYSY